MVLLCTVVHSAAGFAVGVQSVATAAAAVVALLRVDALVLTAWFVQCTVVDPSAGFLIWIQGKAFQAAAGIGIICVNTLMLTSVIR